VLLLWRRTRGTVRIGRNWSKRPIQGETYHHVVWDELLDGLWTRPGGGAVWINGVEVGVIR
jgi:hypothetical protein